LKPENFLIGLEKNVNTIYVIDYGLAKRYRDPVSNQHIPYRENKPLAGTARYSSINCHLGIEQTRRDDLESLGYIMIYFIKGSLPWQGAKGGDKKAKFDKLKDGKLKIPLQDLCKGLPCKIK